MPAYELFSRSEIMGRMAMGRMLGALSSRRYTLGLEPVGENVERAASATSKSAVSRRFVALTENALADLLAAPLIDDLDFEIDLFVGIIRGRMTREPGYAALQQIPGIGPTLAAVFVAKIGDITRFGSAAKLACWAGLAPQHHESDTHVRRGRIIKQGSRLLRWAAIESVKTISKGTPIGILRAGGRPPREQHRLGGCRKAPAEVRLLHTAR